jgi:hypothetical protein
VSGVRGTFEGDGGDGVADKEEAVLGAVEDQPAEDLRRDARRLERLAHEGRGGIRGGDEEDALFGIEGEASVGGSEAALEEAADGEGEEEGEVLFVALLLCGVRARLGDAQARSSVIVWSMIARQH